jgi:hypothetical protein
MTRFACLAALLAGICASTVAAAQQPASADNVVSATFTIAAIDHSARIVTLKDNEGRPTDVFCGPEVQRFDALKVGDKVTFRYHESLVTAIRRAGAAPRAPEANAVTRTSGTVPGATVSQQLSAAVTIEALDAKVPSVTLKTQNGSRLSLKVNNPKTIEGYKVGDVVDVTYTQAIAISVAPAQ